MKLSRKKMLAFFLCACLLAFTLLSLALGVQHAGHTCMVGQPCKICACVEHSRSVFRALQLLLACALAGSLPAISGGRIRLGELLPVRFATPVSMRVRMNH